MADVHQGAGYGSFSREERFPPLLPGSRPRCGNGWPASSTTLSSRCVLKCNSVAAPSIQLVCLHRRPGARVGISTLVCAPLAQLLPVENVDGRLAWEAGDLCLRKTAKGVDLNRNYPFGFASEVRQTTAVAVQATTCPAISRVTAWHNSTSSAHSLSLNHLSRMLAAPPCRAATAQRDVRRSAPLQRAAEPHDCPPGAQRSSQGPGSGKGEDPEALLRAIKGSCTALLLAQCGWLSRRLGPVAGLHQCAQRRMGRVLGMGQQGSHWPWPAGERSGRATRNRARHVSQPQGPCAFGPG